MDFSSLLSFNTVTVAIVVILLILLVSRSLQWPANIPPGPPGYPILGNIPLLRQGNVMEIFRNLREQYGDVFSLKTGTTLTVVINGMDAFKEAFVKRGDEFSDRAFSYVAQKIFESKGIASSSGDYCKLTRTFLWTTLGEFGLGERSLESRAQKEITACLDIIEKQNGQPYDVKQLIVNAVSNITCSISFGNRFEYTDAKFKRVTSLFSENFRLIVATGVFKNMPCARYLPGDMFKIKELIRNMSDIKAFMREQIDEHRKTFDDEIQRDLIDAFLKQQNIHGNDNTTIFEDINLSAIIMNLFSAGTGPTSSGIRWAILYLIHNKHIQDKLRQEIETVVGTSRLPSLADKSNMPYYEAFVSEALRMGNPSAFAIPHGALKDIQFRGMTIPKGSVILIALDSVMNDPNIFESPGTFQPERFLGADGQLNGKEKTVIAFGIGRRICPGESLARLETFLLMTSLLQRFEILPENPDQLPSLEPIPGLARMPKDFNCRLVKLK